MKKKNALSILKLVHDVITTYLNLLTVLWKINEPSAVVIGAVVVGEIGRDNGLARADDAAAIWQLVADIKTRARYWRIRLSGTNFETNYALPFQFIKMRNLNGPNLLDMAGIEINYLKQIKWQIIFRNQIE